MKHKTTILNIAAIIAASCCALSIQAADLPKVRVLATGGTIAGAQASATDYGYKSGAYDVNSLLSAVPNLDKLAVITGEQVANIGSQDMSDEVWLKLAKRLNAVLGSPDADGALITHGTDTLEETSYFLSLVTKSDKPVVMVGSMRPATAISADGPGNIYNGVAIVADPRAKGKGTLVSLNDAIHFARNVVKTDTTSVQTFESINRGPAGVVHTGKVEWFEPMDRKVGNATEFSVDTLDKLPRVDVIYAHANMSADLIDAAVRNGAKGLVIAGVGDGNATTPALDALFAWTSITRWSPTSVEHFGPLSSTFPDTSMCARCCGDRKPDIAPAGVIRIVPSPIRAERFPSAPTMKPFW